MIVIKSAHDLEIMRIAGRISAEALRIGGESVKPGVTTKEINDVIDQFIRSQGATPSFLGYNGFPGSACISINDEVIHGIPGNRKLVSGDIVSIDVGAIYQGLHGDNAATFACGEIADELRQLMDVTEQSLHKGIEAAVAGNRVGDISNAVQIHVEQFGYGVVREFVGHGIGREMHQSPEVPNFGKPGRGARLTEGMTIAIEPMINLSGADVEVLEDGWTVLTKSRKPSAHFEHTIAITQKGPVILTRP